MTPCLAQNFGNDYSLILSAGRTGATYLVTVLTDAYPDIRVLGEKEPARSVLVLNNLADLELPLASVLAARVVPWLVHRSRQGFRKRWVDEHIVEINPFFSGLGHKLEVVGANRIIHIVRHPVDWVHSAIGFGSYSWRRPIVPYLPLARERPPIGDRTWRNMSETERFAWRWRRRNSRIREFCNGTDTPVLVVKYEDLFQGNEANIDTLRHMLGHIGLDPGKLTPQLVPASKINPTLSRHRSSAPDHDAERIMRICSDEAMKYGYT